MAFQPGSNLDADPEKTAATTEASSYVSDIEAAAEKPTPQNPHDDPDRDEAEWMDRGHMHDLESQKSHVRALQLSKNKNTTDRSRPNQSEPVPVVAATQSNESPHPAAPNRASLE
jgi:hypothetical protein